MTIRVTAAVLSLLIGTGAAAAAQSPLADLLGLIPDGPEVTHSVPVFGFVDFRAMERAASVATPASEAAFGEMPGAARKTWIDAIAGIAVGPLDLIQYPGGVGSGTVTGGDAIGIDWFAVDRAMTIGQPPNLVTIAAGDDDISDKAAIDAALTRRDFGRREIGDFSVWHRFDDNELVLALEDALADGDFLMGRLPRAERIAVRPGLVIAAANWPAVEATVASAAGEAKTSPAALLSRSILAAVDAAFDADLLQAAAFMLRDVGSANDPAAALPDLLVSPVVDIDKMRALLAPDGEMQQLPLYPLALVGEWHAGGERLAVIALPYPDRESAELAATTVASRIATWRSAEDAEPLLATTGGKVEAKVVDRDGVAAEYFATFLAALDAGEEVRRAVAGLDGLTGGAVAVVALRYPAEGADDKAGSLPVFRIWLDGIYRRAFTPLAAP